MHSRVAHQNYFDAHAPEYIEQGYSGDYILLVGIKLPDFMDFENEGIFDEKFFTSKEQAGDYLDKNYKGKIISVDGYLIRKIPKTLEKHLDQTDISRIVQRELKLIKDLKEASENSPSKFILRY